MNIQFQYTRVLTLVSWTGFNEITESDVLEKERTRLSYPAPDPFIYSFIFIFPPSLQKEAQGSPRNIMPICSFHVVHVEKVNALINVVYIQFLRAFRPSLWL